MLLVFLQQMDQSKVTESKTALERGNCNNVRARKMSIENFSWSNNFTQVQVTQNQDFVVPVLDSSRASVAPSAGQK